MANFKLCMPVTLEEDNSSASSASVYYPSQFMDFFELVPPEGFRERNGDLIENADEKYPKLWEYLLKPENNWKSISVEKWQDMHALSGSVGGVPYFAQDASTRKLRLPDTRGDIVKYAGRPYDSAYNAKGEEILNSSFTGKVGDWHDYAQEQISGKMADAYMTPKGLVSGVFHMLKTGDGLSGASNNNSRTITFDNSRMAKTALETRPRAFTMLGCVYMG